jgi:hypothetical protein
VATGLREDRGVDSGGFQIHFGVDLAELNERTARLRGTTVRKGFFTSSMDLAIAGGANRYQEWPLGPGVDAGSAASAACEELGDTDRGLAVLGSMLDAAEPHERSTVEAAVASVGARRD